MLINRYILPPETKFVPTTFVEGRNLKLTCTISAGSYSSVTLLKVTGDGSVSLAVFNNNGTNQVLTPRGTVSYSFADSGLNLHLDLDNAGCHDNGTYACRHDNTQTSYGDATITSK